MKTGEPAGTKEPTATNRDGFSGPDQPQWEDYSRCIRCGLCLNQCPTYRELGTEMDSPRGRIYQIAQVAEGRLPMGEDFVRHIDLCLDCRACETACPSGVRYGRIVESARAQIEQQYRRPTRERILRNLAMRRLLPSPVLLKTMGALLGAYQRSGLQSMVRKSGALGAFPHMKQLDRLAPTVETPSFFSQIGKTNPPRGARRYRVAFHAGCVANICFARLNEATVRVLQEHGCEVIIPSQQVCCGALPVHAGMREVGRRLARRNIGAFDESVDAILTNAAGCGSTLKEYGELLDGDSEWRERANGFAAKMRDVTEFLAEVGLTREPRALNSVVTYQDSCHLAHGQKIRRAPRDLLKAVPGLRLVEMPLSDQCCGSAGIYNITETALSIELLRKKMEAVNSTGAQIIATANPGCMLQLRAGVQMFGNGQRVAHIVELLEP